MAPLQMVDLKRQYQKIKPEVDAAIAAVIDSTAFIAGKDVQSFAGELAGYLGVRYVIPCANGTDALQIALMALGLKPGDEVITPSFTYFATVEVVALLGLKPVFVEVLPDTFTMDPASLKAAITPKTRAIIPVHLYGQSAPMKEILDIAAGYNIPVIEDNAQAIGGSYTFPDGTVKMNGSMGSIGTTSFFPSKNLGCYGDGGAMFTNDDVLAEKLKMIANHGQKVRYYHDMIGCNSRLDSIQAAILRVKLKELQLKDLESVEKKIARVEKMAKADPKQKAVLEILLKCKTHLEQGKNIRALGLEGEDREAIADIFLLTEKPVLYVANVDEASMLSGNKYSDAISKVAAEEGAQVIIMNNNIEAQITELESEEDKELFFSEYGLTEPGLNRLIRAAYQLLNLITYFTAGVQEVRAWTIHKGWKAPQAAGVIHTDFEKGFIKAEVIGYDDYITLGGELPAKEKGNYHQAIVNYQLIPLSLPRKNYI